MSDSAMKKILIVEDDADLRHILSDRLSSYNYEVFQAEDGEKAIELIQAHRPQLVVLDLLLPKKDGFQVLDEVRHHAERDISDTLIIVLSNLWSNKDILKVKALRVDEYYVKANTNLEEVFDKIKAVMKTQVLPGDQQ